MKEAAGPNRGVTAAARASQARRSRHPLRGHNARAMGELGARLLVAVPARRAVEGDWNAHYRITSDDKKLVVAPRLLLCVRLLIWERGNMGTDRNNQKHDAFAYVDLTESAIEVIGGGTHRGHLRRVPGSPSRHHPRAAARRPVRAGQARGHLAARDHRLAGLRRLRRDRRALDRVERDPRRRDHVARSGYRRK